ncbi:PepSY domain-containing protein [Desulforudis sp. DRI-14]|uniref:PepSY domain-containing protein n=1 Tax=Desulforudis sp. DRI-14 TaxID=3459793 RepID=UPI0040436A04
MFTGYRRRLVAAMTAASLLLPGALPAPALAAEPAPAVATAAAAQNKVTLEQAIRIAKKAYPGVGRFDEFSSDYNEYEGRGVWELRWSKEGEAGGGCDMTISTATGEIIHLGIWQSSPSGRYSGMPAYTRAQAQTVAEKAARRLAPEKFARCTARLFYQHGEDGIKLYVMRHGTQTQHGERCVHLDPCARLPLYANLE